MNWLIDRTLVLFKLIKNNISVREDTDSEKVPRFFAGERELQPVPIKKSPRR